MNRVRILSLAAILGLLGGLITAFVAPDLTRSASDTADPLHLSIPLVNQDCSGASILVVGFGESRAPLAAAAADNTKGAVRYLRSADSCPAVYGAEDAPAPAYVAYLGPYENTSEACSERMNVEHKGDHVTRLRQGSEIHVQCVCELPVATFPTLSVGSRANGVTGIWTRALQESLDDLGRNPTHHVNGHYDQETANQVSSFQQAKAITVSGVVDAVTWRILRTRACRTYDY